MFASIIFILLVNNPAPINAKSIGYLKDGNSRFLNGTVNHPNQIAVATRHLVKKQNPHTAILSCSDSRADPGIVFDQGLGDVFDIRVAGNVVNSDVIGSLEYAVEVLSVETLLVMGHESCGAVHAAIENKKFDHDHKHIADLVHKIDIGPRLKSDKSAADNVKNEIHREEAVHNVMHSMSEIMRRSKVIRSKVLSGKISLNGAVYSLQTGKADFFQIKQDSKGVEIQPL